MFARLLLIAAAAAPAGPESADAFRQALDALDEPARLMALTCVSHVVNNNDLESFLGSDPAYLPYSGQQAAPFLQGHEGKAWGFQVNGRRYVVAHTAGGICSLHAQTAVRDTAAAGMKALLELLYPGGVVPMPLPGQPTQDGPPSLHGWSVHDARLRKTYHFTALVAPQDNAMTRAVYSVLVTPAGTR